MSPVKAHMFVRRDGEGLPSGTPTCCMHKLMAWRSVLTLSTTVPCDTICPTVEGVVIRAMPDMSDPAWVEVGALAPNCKKANASA